MKSSKVRLSPHEQYATNFFALINIKLISLDASKKLSCGIVPNEHIEIFNFILVNDLKFFIS